jgi:hypothetical protein
MEGLKETTLSQALDFRTQQEPWKFFLNPQGQLEIFSHYKAKLIECHKEDIRLQLGKITKEELDNYIRLSILGAIKTGGQIVFTSGQDANFDWKKFFGQFSFIKEGFWKKENLMKREYLLKTGLLTKHEDEGFFQDKGGFLPRDDYGMSFLCVCGDADYSVVRKLLPEGAEMEFWLVY